MQTKEQVEITFRTELQALLNKYQADLEASDHYQGYPECGENIRMIVSIPGIYSFYAHRIRIIREYTEVDLGNSVFHSQGDKNGP